MLGPWVRDLGVIGVLVWYLWFHAAKVQPRHEAEVSRLATEFHVAVVKMSENCRYLREGLQKDD